MANYNSLEEMLGERDSVKTVWIICKTEKRQYKTKRQIIEF